MNQKPVQSLYIALQRIAGTPKFKGALAARATLPIIEARSLHTVMSLRGNYGLNKYRYSQWAVTILQTCQDLRRLAERFHGCPIPTGSNFQGKRDFSHVVLLYYYTFDLMIQTVCLCGRYSKNRAKKRRASAVLVLIADNRSIIAKPSSVARIVHFTRQSAIYGNILSSLANIHPFKTMYITINYLSIELSLSWSRTSIRHSQSLATTSYLFVIPLGW